MYWASLYLSLLSVASVQPVLANHARSFKLPNAQSVDDGTTFAAVSDYALPAARVVTDHSKPHWEGTSWHYSIPSASGKTEEFSVHIIDYEVPADDPDYHYNGTLESRSLVDLDQRVPGWACQWVVACFDAGDYAVRISANQISAVVLATRARLNANDGELQKRLTDGGIVAFAVSVVSAVPQFYIGQKLQLQDKQATDTCNTDAISARLDKIEQNQRDMMNALGIGPGKDNRPRVYDHYSENSQDQTEGQHLKHSLKATQNPNDQKNVNC